ncbi:MAG: PaaI family thioesterase [Pacificimonas sp.]|jgi:uncharacterized protein (TIGR00369 family)|nr:PaaI family thioesterase [Pacificimonas sp.]
MINNEFDPALIAEAEAPEGFFALPFNNGFIGVNGPIFVKADPADPVFGMRILERMCNPLGVAHGGLIATFLDMALPLAMRFSDEAKGEASRFMLTVNLSIDYLAGAKMGDWLEGRARLLKRTGRMAFIDGVASTKDGPVARGSGVFRLGGEAPRMAGGSG